MTDGHELLPALVERASGYRDHAPVFRVVPSDPKALSAEARTISAALWPWFGECQPRLMPVVDGVAALFIPEGGNVGVFYPSGALAGALLTTATRKPIAIDEKKADRKALADHAHKLATTIAKHRVGANDELRFEALWETKAQGVTLKGEKSAVALLEVVGAFRRYLHGLPVWGRASVHVGIGANSAVTKWGIDWRRVATTPFAKTPVIDPKEGAKRVLDDLAWRRPEQPFTLDDFVPASFLLGYHSFTRRREQAVMQPAWVAVLKPRGDTTMGHVIAVPAAPHAYEPMGRPARMARLPSRGQ